jgi:tripartite ATP-independent transporter DctM subunit
MDLCGVGLIGLAGVLIVMTGLPAYMVLCCVTLCGAVFGLVWGGLPPAVFAALPARLINLLDNDLLQALPLYVVIGVLLDRLPLTAALYRSIRRAFGHSTGADPATVMTMGGLLGPMNGSVGANVLGLCRSIYPRLLQAGVPVPQAQGLICVASTLGVVIPPSLVLILLGDAMMGAHITALQGTARTDRIINTHDIFHGVLAPALLLLIGFVVMALMQGKTRQTPTPPATPLLPREAGTALITLCVLVGLLGGVGYGVFYAVEAAATGAVLLLLYGIWGGHLSLTIMRDCLQEAAATTGALFALLVAATSFTLILRLLGTDRLMASWLLGLDMAPLLFLCLILVLVTLAALVLDAFEIIFVIIPLFAPPLLMRVDDAVWVSVCLLLTLQLAFLLPPIGYAVMMTRGLTKPHVPLRQVMHAIKPYLALQALCLVLVLVWPASVHLFDSPQSRTRQGQGMITPTPIETQLKQLMPVQEMPALPHR